MTRRLVARLAPSPTGVLHVGNARSLLLAWLSARAAGGRVLLRIEDLLPDGEPHIDGLLRDLTWLGLDWDEGGGQGDLWLPSPPRDVDGRRIGGFLRQADRATAYQAVLERLVARGLVYPCICTRKDIEGAARAPHAEDRGAPYPGTCRGRFSNEDEALAEEMRRSASEGRAPLGVAWRLRVPETPFACEDGLCGHIEVRLPDDSGDIVVRRKDGGFAYMFAVVVDDLAMGVTEVVRGDDLLTATLQQLALYAALREVAQPPTDAFWQRAATWTPPRHLHVPLVLGDDGRRLAKRNRSLHLHALSESGLPAGRLRSWLAQSIGLPMTPNLSEMISLFSWNDLPRQPVMFGHDALAALALPQP